MLVLLAMFSCKKEEPKKEPFYDDFVNVGEYINLDRWGTSMQVLKTDSTMLWLNVGTGTSITQYVLRKNRSSAGYEWPYSYKIVRFKKTDLGYEIAGDTLQGWFFKRTR